jgi:hypothetical protein
MNGKKKVGPKKKPAPKTKLPPAPQPGRIHTINRKELAQIAPHFVAMVAAQIQTNESNPIERVRMAFRLLDIAESANRGLKQGTSYDGGLSAYEFAQMQENARLVLNEDRLKDPLIVKCPDGLRRADFDKVLKKFFGLAKGKDIRHSDRHERFVSYVADTGAPMCVAGIHVYILGREKGPLMSRQAAKETVQEWKEKGIPSARYVVMKRLFRWWWEDSLSRTRSRVARSKSGPIEEIFDAEFFDEIDADFEVVETTTVKQSKDFVDFVGLDESEIPKKK